MRFLAIGMIGLGLYLIIKGDNLGTGVVVALVGLMGLK